MNKILVSWLPLLVLFLQVPVAAELDQAKRVVRYEDFGAVGDGKTDDLPAICQAHAHANANNLPVQSNPKATYHLGTKALTASIQTDTEWGTSKFLIDDSKGVENHRKPLFEVRSQKKPVPLKIDRLQRGQTRLNNTTGADCLVYVENKHRKIFIRKGGNQNSGSVQKEVFLLQKNGSIHGAIEWDYDVITRIKAIPIDTHRLVLQGGHFTHIANQRPDPEDTSYWARNILIRRSNTEVNGITHRVTHEKEFGNPHNGFIQVQECANVTLRDCRIDARKVYHKLGNSGKTVPMGTYGYSATLVVDLRISQCTMEDIHDRSRWGVMATNFIKNFVVEDSVLSRVDVHQGISGVYVIRRSTVGYAGINAVGRGRLVIEDCTLHGGNLVSFREDYGSPWDGDVIIRNSRWIPRVGNPVMFSMRNDGTHDFGYPCSMPRRIQIDALEIDDSKLPKGRQGVTFFNDPIGPPRKNRRFPYRLTETLEVRGLKIASGLTPQISSNPELAKTVRVVRR